MNRLPRWMSSAGPPLALFILVLSVWEFAVVLGNIPAYLLPKPSAVFEAAVENRSALLTATGRTAAAAVCGFLLSLIAGTLTGCLFSQSKLIRRSLYPYAIFLQTVPMIAVAPLIIIWCGYGFPSVVVVSFIISLFPILANATAGLTVIDPELLELFRLYRATRWQTLTKLRLPHAVPYLVAGAKTSAGLSVIGAIVGEFFAGYGSQQFGLGYLVLHGKDQIKTAALFAAVGASTLLGILVFGCVSIVGSTILRRWYDEPADH